MSFLDADVCKDAEPLGFYVNLSLFALIGTDLVPVCIIGAQVLSVYERDFYQGMPVITKNRFGQGCAYYVGTRSNSEFYHHFLEDIFTEAKIEETMAAPKGIEAAIRVKGDRKVLFLMNHNKFCRIKCGQTPTTI